MKPTEKEVIRIAEEQVLDFYEKYNVPLSERKNFNINNETAEKGISNNIPKLVKEMKEKSFETKVIAFMMTIIIFLCLLFFCLLIEKYLLL